VSSERVPTEEVRAFFASFAELDGDGPGRSPLYVEPDPLVLERLQRIVANHRTQGAAAAEEIEQRHAAVAGSPIEVRLLPLIVAGGSPLSDRAMPEFDGAPLCEIGPWRAYAQLAIGRYIADLAFVALPERVVVECDGHEFHERTPAQAAHDRRRDRWMQANGWAVLRFTGSEIHRDPNGCADEVRRFLRARRPF
jgi:very-short-patch-repair endonuclease